MAIDYEGYYARFNTVSKKDSAILCGADCIVGDDFTFEIKQEKDGATCWLSNRWGAVVGYFDPEVSRKIQLALARGLKVRILLSFVAFTDNPDPGHYWGETAVICYPPAYQQEFDNFVDRVAKRMIDGIRTSLDLGQQGVKLIAETNGDWVPDDTVPLPKKMDRTVIIKSKRSTSEGFIEQGRKKNPGCYVVGIGFIVVVVALVVFAVLKIAGIV